MVPYMGMIRLEPFPVRIEAVAGLHGEQVFVFLWKSFLLAVQRIPVTAIARIRNVFAGLKELSLK